YLEEFPGKEDELRYCLIANMPENKDAEFTWQDFQNRVNNELAANLGNFVNRVAVLTHKFYKGEIPNVDTATYSVVFDEINELKQKLHT
ncbi:MAG TPA: class I tRNA ligase family protein, partial [Chitinophagales bacterium]|nr:class I tRNA ligase family protein [Chitinophagales bacterium]